MAAVSYDENPMTGATIEVDIGPALRRAFGLWRWRLTLARLCFRLAALVLRCGVEVNFRTE